MSINLSFTLLSFYLFNFLYLFSLFNENWLRSCCSWLASTFQRGHPRQFVGIFAKMQHNDHKSCCKTVLSTSFYTRKCKHYNYSCTLYMYIVHCTLYFYLHCTKLYCTMYNVHTLSFTLALTYNYNNYNRLFANS